MTSSSVHHAKVEDQSVHLPCVASTRKTWLKSCTILPCPHQHLSSRRSPKALAIVVLVVPLSPVETPQKGGISAAIVVVDPSLTTEQLLTCSLIHPIIVVVVVSKKVSGLLVLCHTLFSWTLDSHQGTKQDKNRKISSPSFTEFKYFQTNQLLIP